MAALQLTPLRQRPCPAHRCRHPQPQPSLPSPSCVHASSLATHLACMLRVHLHPAVPLNRVCPSAASPVPTEVPVAPIRELTLQAARQCSLAEAGESCPRAGHAKRTDPCP